MRVLLDTRILRSERTRVSGIGRYAACLREALPGAGVTLVAGRRAGPALLHVPSLEGLPLPGRRLPLVVTLHDLAPRKRPDRHLRTGLRHRRRWAVVRRAARVIAPSRAVAADAQRLLGIPEGRLEVIGEAAAPVFRPSAEPRTHLERLVLPDRFLLWVGCLDPPDPRKNVEALADAVARRDGPPLVLAGRASDRAQALAAPGRVSLTGPLSDAELAALYAAADALVLPSHDEGFGLTAVEALACGTPVVAFAAGSLPEVLDGAEGAELVEPGDIEGLLAAAEAAAGRPVTGPGRTWADVARETAAAYGRAVAR
jgi:glycosyltransferase involved in cell wall biosynthesis